MTLLIGVTTLLAMLFITVKANVAVTPEKLYKASRQLICIFVIAIIALIILAIVYYLF